jgi:hypothetical protein
MHAGHEQAGKSRRVKAEWPTYRAGSSKEEKKENSNVAYSTMTSNAMEFCVAPYVYDIHEWINFAGMLQ